MLGNFHDFLLSADILKITFLRVSNSLDPDQDRQNDQDRHSVGPDLGPNCLQRLTADEKKCR